MKCDEATRLMSEGQDRPLGVGERTSVRLHTWMCAGCRQFNAQLGFIRQAVRGFAARGARPNDDDEPGVPPVP
jgi:hypothetical protein